MKVLIVGGGSIGERHLRCFASVLGAAPGLCEINDELRERLVDQYRPSTTFASLDQALDAHWDAAVICTPAHCHVDHAMQLLPSVDALLIEKPLATQLADAERLVAAAKGRTVGVAYVFRAHPAVQAVRKALDAGEIGRLRQVTSVAGQHFPTFRPAYREIYYARRETGGGAIQDAATHTLDLVQHLAGPLDWIFCDYAHQVLPDVEVEDTVHITARAQGGEVLVSLALNQFMAPNESVVQLNGDRGSLRIELHAHRWGKRTHEDDAWHWSPALVTERDELFRLQATAFLAAASGDAALLCDLNDGLSTLRANLAALESAGQRRVALTGVSSS